MAIARQIPDRYKLIFLGSCFLGCLCTLFIPYNSFHLPPSSSALGLGLRTPPPLNGGPCAIIRNHHREKCGSSSADDGGDQRTEDCKRSQENVDVCLRALVKAYGEINLSGCLKYIAALNSCKARWCNGDESFGDIVSVKRRDTDGSASNDSGDGDGNRCKGRCADKADKLLHCQLPIIRKWLRRYGVKNEEGRFVDH